MNLETKRYHAICPILTYLKEGYCYKEPVNQVEFTVFPVWSEEDQLLSWLFTVEHSNMITKDVLSDYLTV